MEEMTLICYEFSNIHYVKRRQFIRKLFGAEEKTHGGKYVARIKGFLSDKEYQKPVRSVIVIHEVHKDGVLKILKKFRAKTYVFKIIRME